MKVVSNSSILIGLSAIGRLELLHRRFPEGVIVPDAVWQEVVETGHGRTGAERKSRHINGVVVKRTCPPVLWRRSRCRGPVAPADGTGVSPKKTLRSLRPLRPQPAIASRLGEAGGSAKSCVLIQNENC